MRISFKMPQSSNAHGKRPLEEDSHGGGSTKFKLRRCRPVDSSPDFPSSCGQSADVEKVGGPADQHPSRSGRPTTDSGEINRDPVEIGDDSDRDDDCVITDGEAAKSPKKHRGFEWVEANKTRVDEPEDFNRDDAAGEEEGDDDYQPNADESEDSCYVGGDDAAGEEEAEETDCRSKVQEIRKQFQDLYNKLALEYEQERNGGPITKRVASKAAMILKKEKKFLNSKATFGHVPGVEIGDRFKFRSEIAVVGLHSEFNSGISSKKIGNKEYAVSVVESGRYNNRTKPSGVLIYSGHGGNIDVRASCSRDQALEGGNLALKNSIDARYPVRVIRKIEVLRHTYEYFYDGVYNVVEFWPETSNSGKTVYMFKMVRIEGQPVIDYVAICRRKRYQRKKPC